MGVYGCSSQGRGSFYPCPIGLTHILDKDMPTPDDLKAQAEMVRNLQKLNVPEEPDFTLLTGKIYKATEDSAAFDLYYDGKHDWIIEDKPTGIPTGVRTKFKPGFVCIIKEKSG